MSTVVARTRDELAVAREKLHGTVAVVMTMGALHAGHAELPHLVRDPLLDVRDGGAVGGEGGGVVGHAGPSWSVRVLVVQPDRRLADGAAQNARVCGLAGGRRTGRGLAARRLVVKLQQGFHFGEQSGVLAAMLGDEPHPLDALVVERLEEEILGALVQAGH